MGQGRWGCGVGADAWLETQAATCRPCISFLHIICICALTPTRATLSHSQVASIVEVSWVTPRILTPAQLRGLKTRLDGWVGRVAAVAAALESESVGMLAAAGGGSAAAAAAVGVSA